MKKSDFSNLNILSFMRFFMFGFIILVTSLAVFIVSLVFIFGLRPEIVGSNVMSPTLDRGSLSFTRVIPIEDVEVGDIVTLYSDKDTVYITRRVAEIQNSKVLFVKTDQDGVVDLHPYYVSEVRKLVFSVPFIGFFALIFESFLGTIFIALIVIIFVASFLLDSSKSRDSKNKRSRSNKSKFKDTSFKDIPVGDVDTKMSDTVFSDSEDSGSRGFEANSFIVEDTAKTVSYDFIDKGRGDNIVAESTDTDEELPLGGRRGRRHSQ